MLPALRIPVDSSRVSFDVSSLHYLVDHPSRIGERLLKYRHDLANYELRSSLITTQHIYPQAKLYFALLRGRLLGTVRSAI
jgi:hypothetical protein